MKDLSASLLTTVGEPTTVSKFKKEQIYAGL